MAAIEDAYFGLNMNESARDGTESVEFSYTNYLVKVRNDGWIQVYEPNEPEKV